ncbi:Protein of unknown function [Pyronema omphalodes CBS 100304]|uniref:Uncharacterized protein n=1 Tax=Pyronema omphalodes (strain CBS 100304) TaxID=1076935 RepID=U4LL67_PYROM|nr:Protein of unknown function [Pyronema omphalodes CBS 100304]
MSVICAARLQHARPRHAPFHAATPIISSAPVSDPSKLWAATPGHRHPSTRGRRKAPFLADVSPGHHPLASDCLVFTLAETWQSKLPY